MGQKYKGKINVTIRIITSSISEIWERVGKKKNATHFRKVNDSSNIVLEIEKVY